MNTSLALLVLFFLSPAMALGKDADVKACSGSALSHLKIASSGQACGFGGTFQEVVNSCPSSSVFATIRIESTPNPGTYPQQRQIFAPAGGRTSIGCDRVGPPAQNFGYSIVGAMYGKAGPEVKAADPIPSFVDFWNNELKSEMQIKKVNPDGMVYGCYRSAVGTKFADWYPMIGWTQGDIISFSVNFGEKESITAWAGQLVKTADGSERLNTVWHLVSDVVDADEEQRGWAMFLTNSDRFARGKSPLHDTDPHGNDPCPYF